MAAQVPSRLYRSRAQKMLAGVCGGLGEYFDVDPVLIRLLFVVTAFISGAGILAYLVLWIVVPFEGDDGPRFDGLKRDFDDLSGRIREYVDRPGAGRAAGAGRDTPPGAAQTGSADPYRPGQGGAASSASAASSSVDLSAGPRAHAAGPASQPFEGASMASDTASSRLPRSDDPAATADLTIDADAPATASSRSAGSATGAASSGPIYEAQSMPGGPATGASASTGTTTDNPGAPWDAPYGPSTAQQYGAGPGASYGTPPYSTPLYTAGPASYGPPIERKRRRQHWAGAILIIIGLLILAGNLGLLRWARPEYVVPLILVVAGAWLLFGRGRRG